MEGEEGAHGEPFNAAGGGVFVMVTDVDAQVHVEFSHSDTGRNGRHPLSNPIILREMPYQLI